jgi:transposase
LSATIPTSCYAGVDVSKGRLLDIFLRPAQEHFSVPNEEAGIGALVSRLEQARPALVVLESSGGFERLVAAALVASELPIVVVNPRHVRDFARATGKLAKTDRLDAEVLARFGEAVGPEPKPLPDKEARAFGEVLARRRQIVGMLTAERNRLATATSEPVKKRIEAHVRWLERELERIEGDLDEAIKGSRA